MTEVKSPTVQVLPIDQIQPNPSEPPQRMEVNDELRELAASIDALGLLQPIGVVALDEGSWQIDFGHRRWAACKELGLASIPCMVLDDDAGSLERLIAENEQRKDVDALTEAGLVAQLMDVEDDEGRRPTQEDVAKRLGRSPRWVARRVNLANLSPEARKLREEDEVFANWPPAWLEELALLSPKQQNTLLGLRPKKGPDKHGTPELLERAFEGDALRVGSIEELQKLIAAELMVLKRAPWDLHDSELVPAVGSCADCPKTSCAAVTLFGLEGGQDLSTAQCRDRLCWNGKARAHLERQVAEQRDKHGEALVLAHGTSKRGMRGCDKHDGKGLPPKVPVLDSHQYHHCKKTTPGARPALIIDGDHEGKVKWVKRGPKPESGAGGQQAALEKDATGRTPLAVRKQRLYKRRRNQALDALAAAVAEASWSEVAQHIGDDSTEEHQRVLLDLIGRFGCQNPSWHAQDKWGDELWATLKPLPADERNEVLWQGVREEASHHVSRQRDRDADEQPKQPTRAMFLAELIGFDWKGAMDAACEALPEPASWAQEEAAAAAKGGRKKKATRKKKGGRKAGARRGRGPEPDAAPEPPAEAGTDEAGSDAEAAGEAAEPAGAGA